MLALLLPLLFYPVQVLSAQGSNFDVSIEVSEGYGCDEACYKILLQTNQADLAIVGDEFDQDFYDVSEKFAGSKPGDLLKLKPVDPTTLKSISGVSVYKIQYTSEDLDGAPIPVSGFVALPYALPKSGAFPLVAFAHGTVGIYPGCAVSNGPDLFTYSDVWSGLSKRGYAVVATDYAGLGVNATQHQYLTFPALAKDVFHSVTAARKAFGHVLSERWLSFGHSQGGGVAWKLAEDIEALAAANHSGSGCEAANYIGTVAAAPATKVYDFWKYFTTQILPRPDFHTFSLVGLAPLAATGARRLFPAFNFTMFGGKARGRLLLTHLVQPCAAATAGLTLDLTAEELVSNPGSDEDLDILKQWQELAAPANGGRVHGPMLIIQGLGDTAVPAPLTVNGWKDACGDGNEIELLLYQKMDHSSMLEAAAPDYLRWIDARFAGEEAREGCKKITRKPWDYKYVESAPELDLTGLSL